MSAPGSCSGSTGAILSIFHAWYTILLCIHCWGIFSHVPRWDLVHRDYSEDSAPDQDTRAVCPWDSLPVMRFISQMPCKVCLGQLSCVRFVRFFIFLR